MSLLPPTPNLGLQLPNPSTGQPYSRAGENAWWTTVDSAFGDLWGMANPATQRLRADNSSDMSLTSTAHGFQIGPTGGTNLRGDNNELQVATNGVASQMNIQPEGGILLLGKAASDPVYLGGTPLHSVNPTAVSVSGGSALIDANGWTGFTSVSSMRLTEIFAGYSGYDAFEFLWEITDSPAPGTSQPLLMGLANGTTTRSTLQSVYRGFSDSATATMLAGGTGTNASDCNIGFTGNIALPSTVVHGNVYFPMSSGERTLITYRGATNVGNGTFYEGTVINTVPQVDDGLRIGRGGSGVVTGRLYMRRIGR